MRYTLTIEVEHEVPEDVLVEHIGYALRTGLQRTGRLEVTISGRHRISHVRVPEES